MPKQPDSNFRKDVESFVARIPRGQVTTYGDLAALSGHPYAARVVGGIAHFGNPELPWQRVVNRFGGLASGYPGGKEGHAEHLRLEGIESTDYIVNNFKELRWKPKELFP